MRNQSDNITRLLWFCLLYLLFLTGCGEKGSISADFRQTTKTVQLVSTPVETNSLVGTMTPNNTDSLMLPTQTFSADEIPEGNVAYFSHQNVQSIHILNLGTLETSEVFSDLDFPPISMKWSSNRKFVAFISHKIIEKKENEIIGFLRVLDVDLGRIIFSTLEGSPCNQNILGYDWSPNSQSIAFSCGGSIWIHDVVENYTDQITNTYGLDVYPAWSPDGKTLVFDSRIDNKSD